MVVGSSSPRVAVTVEGIHPDRLVEVLDSPFVLLKILVARASVRVILGSGAQRDGLIEVLECPLVLLQLVDAFPRQL